MSALFCGFFFSLSSDEGSSEREESLELLLRRCRREDSLELLLRLRLELLRRRRFFDFFDFDFLRRFFDFFFFSFLLSSEESVSYSVDSDLDVDRDRDRERFFLDFPLEDFLLLSGFSLSSPSIRVLEEVPFFPLLSRYATLSSFRKGVLQLFGGSGRPFRAVSSA